MLQVFLSRLYFKDETSIPCNWENCFKAVVGSQSPPHFGHCCKITFSTTVSFNVVLSTGQFILLNLFRHELKINGTRGSRKGNHIPNIGDPGDHHQKSLKAHTKAGVGHSAKPAGIQVPPIGFFIKAHLIHPGF